MAIDRNSAAGISFANRIYKPRAIGCALSFIYVATTTYPGTWPLWGLMGLNGFIWPYLAYRIALASPAPYQAELRNLQLDCAFAGGWVVAMHFSALPSLLLLSMVAMNCVAAKGIHLLSKGLAAAAAGIFLAGACLGFEVTWETPARVIWACLPMLVIYPFVVGWASYSLAKQLLRQQKALSIVAGFDERMLTPHDRWLCQLAQVFLRCRCGSGQATVAHIRIDDFEALGERHGALVTNALSVRLGHLIVAGLRSTDLVCMRRPGEFLVLLQQARTLGAQALTGRIEEAFEHCFAGGKGLPEARIRVGLAEFTHDLRSENEWLRQAQRHSAPLKTDQPHPTGHSGA
ncbi:MASE2 domain-containing protein [Pseudomonas tohonis]|uniref:MASE2 domain-containing protein n=1 Tax=Pseudomonas tohonis TaxID=2725477 RepID=UPI0022F0632B|nr:MASE2 domain-containing protein [Pseudomonas tohonis]